MSPLVQQWLAYGAVLGATIWLLRRWLRRRSSTAACDRCGPTAPPPPPRRGIRPASLRVLR